MRREVICGETYSEAEEYARELEFDDEEWDWCSSCADEAYANYPDEEES